MRILIQRVSEASVSIEGEIKSQIGKGLLVLLGIEHEDGEEDVVWLVDKLLKLRIFDDEKGAMNISALDIQAEILVVSQFTLHASTKKGARPSYIRAARPEQAIPLYEKFLNQVSEKLGRKCGRGEFGAEMKVSLSNEGPVTIWVDSKSRE